MLFATVMVVLPFGAVAPDNRIAYLVANEEHRSDTMSSEQAEPEEPDGPQPAAQHNPNGIPGQVPRQPLPAPTPKAETEAEQQLPAIGGPAPAAHVVAPGETLSHIAARYNVTVSALMSLNNITNPNFIRPGQTLVLAAAKQTHAVTSGETLSAIAARYAVTLSGLIQENGITNPDRLSVGQILTIPQSKLETLASRSVSTYSMIWPVIGRISSYFGPRGKEMHTGLDVAAPTGTPIKAVRAGRVETAGWIGGYGQTVVLNHGDGLKTLYAHASRLLVKAGERVNQGHIIARVGSTGYSTGPHVHFEVRVGDSFKDPLRYLPDR
jgi:murein DD-endopeptidase MepM/ murein hydrolase activator NlpD